MRKAFFVVGFGLLPLVVSGLLLYWGSTQASPASDYWAVAPWLLIAALPVSGVAFFIAFTTLVIFESTSGSRTRKKKVAATSFGLMILFACGMAGAIWMNRDRNQQDLATEQRLAQEFVKNNPAVIQAAGGKLDVLPANKTLLDGQPIRYEFSISFNPMLYAIVNVSRSSGTPVFTLSCITQLSIGHRDSSKGPCEQQ
jgi:hypothetical protein